MVLIAFSPRQTLSDLDRIVLTSVELQKEVETSPPRFFWCGNRFQREISILKASFEEKTVQIKAASKQHPEEKTVHSQLAQRVEKAKRALDFAAASVERTSSSCATRIYKWLRPHLSESQEKLVKRFVESDKADLNLNVEIVKDPALVKELIRRNIPLRKAKDPLSSLLVALTISSNQTELLGLLLRTKQFTTSDGYHFIRHCLIRNRTLFLEALLEKKRMRNLFPIPPERQIECWLSLSSEEGAHFLKKIGCDPNVRFDGKTPFFILGERSFSFPLSSARLAKILLDAGADPKATCSINGVEKTAFEIALQSNKDPYLQAALIFSGIESQRIGFP